MNREFIVTKRNIISKHIKIVGLEIGTFASNVFEMENITIKIITPKIFNF